MAYGWQVKQAMLITIRKTLRSYQNVDTSGIRITFSGDRAYVKDVRNDGYTVRAHLNLPDIVDTARLSVAQSNRAVAYGLHELCHVLFTDCDAWDSAVSYAAVMTEDSAMLHKVINGLEDPRCERAMIASKNAVGAKGLLSRLVADVIKPDQIEIIIENVPVILAAVCRRYGVGEDALLARLPADLRDIVLEAETRLKLTSNDHTAMASVVDIARQVVRRLAAKKEQDKKQQDKQDKQDKQQQDKGDKSDKSKADKSKGDKQEGKQEGDQGGEQKGQPVEADPFGDIPTAKGADGYSQAAAKARGINDLHSLLQRGTDHSAHTATMPVIRFAIRRLLDSSDKHSRTRGHKSGRLSRDWSGIACGRDDVFERRTVLDGIDTALTVVVDCSGSMQIRDRIKHAKDMAANVMAAVQGLPGVAFKLFGFQRAASDKWDRLLVKDWATSISKAQANFHVLAPCGETPDFEALSYAIDDIAGRQEERKIVIMMTDGRGNDPLAILELNKRAARRGINVIGIGLTFNVDAQYLNPINVKDPAQLTATTFNAVIKAVQQ